MLTTLSATREVVQVDGICVGAFTHHSARVSPNDASWRCNWNPTPTDTLDVGCSKRDGKEITVFQSAQFCNEVL